MPKRSSIHTSLFSDITLSKIIAYILVAYAVCVLVRITWTAIADEPFDIAPPPESHTGSSPIELCQHNTTIPCHRREQRGEDVECNYAWNAPAVFKEEVRVHGTDTRDAMRKLQFCTTVQTNDPRDIRAECNDSHTMDSVWNAFTSGLTRSNRALSGRVGRMEREVRQNTKHVSDSQKAMEEARRTLNASAQQVSTSNDVLSSIDTRLQAQDTCDRKLVQAQTDLTTTQNNLQRTNATLATTKSSLLAANNRIKELVDAQGQPKQMNIHASYSPPS